MKKNLLLIPVLCLVCCACQDRPREGAATQMQEANLDDWQLTANVKTAIMTDTTVSASAKLVTVNSNKGVVTLTGTVPTQGDKTKIEAIAKNVTGVTKVDNQLTVSAK